MNITIYTKSNCPNCVAAKNVMAVRGLKYEEVNLDDEGRRANFMAAYPDAKQTPQIFINDQRVGGLAGLRVALGQMELL